MIWWRGIHVQRPKTVPPPYPVPLRVALYDGALDVADAQADGATASTGMRPRCEAPGRWGSGVETGLAPVPRTLIRRVPAAPPIPTPLHRVIPSDFPRRAARLVR